jgi:excisionase family DNA binding protein
MDTKIRVLTPANLREITGLSLRFIYEKLKDGTIPSKKIGDRYLTTEEMLNDFLKGRTNEPPS